MPSQINSVQNFTNSSLRILLFSSHLGQGISGSSTLQAYQVKPCLLFVLLQASCVLRVCLSLKEHGEECLSLLSKFDLFNFVAAV